MRCVCLTGALLPPRTATLALAELVAAFSYLPLLLPYAEGPGVHAQGTRRPAIRALVREELGWIADELEHP